MTPSLVCCFCLLIGGSLAGQHATGDTNRFVDFFLEGRLPDCVKSLDIDPVMLDPFVIELENFRFFKADLQEGLLHGLSRSLHRNGDCGSFEWERENVTLECDTSVKGLRVSYNGVARGLNELSSRTPFQMDVDVEETTALLKVTGTPGQSATLRDLTLGDFYFRVKIDKVFGLNEWRMRQFENAVSDHLQRSLIRISYSSFMYALKQAVSTMRTPWTE